MLWYVGRRLLQLIPVFLGATLLIYLMVFALPGDPVAALGGERGLAPAVQEQIRAQYNLDQPLLVQYLLYLKGILTLDFGTTFAGRDVGDVIAGLMGAYLIWEARNLGMPKWKLWRMAGNLGVDTALGAIPLVGDAFDLFFRSNSRNLKIIKRHLDKHHPGTIIIDQ